MCNFMYVFIYIFICVSPLTLAFNGQPAVEAAPGGHWGCHGRTSSRLGLQVYPGYEGMNIRGTRGWISGVRGDEYSGYEGMDIRDTRG